MLSIITINETNKWDETVRSFKSYDVYYLNNYSKAFQSYSGGEPILLYYNDGDTRAINVVIKRSIGDIDFFKNNTSFNGYIDLITPYGYGGFLVEGNNYKNINEAYDEFCTENRVISEFTRFHLFNNYHQYYNGNVESNSHNIVRNLDLSIDDMLMDFEHKVRKNINRAKQTGLTIEIDISGKRINEFLEIYYNTMERNNANSGYYFDKKFFDTINEMHDNYAYFHVLYEEKIISTELVLYGSENSYSFLGGTFSEYFHLRPNDFLKFEIIKWAKNKGLKRFVLGGGYGEDDGIYRYKKSFAPNGIYDFYVGKKILDRDKYIELTTYRNKRLELDDYYDTIDTKGFFPKYRDGI